MTKQERLNPDLLNASRRQRIAAGAGVTVTDVNNLMKKFTEMRKMVKKMVTGQEEKKSKRPRKGGNKKKKKTKRRENVTVAGGLTMRDMMSLAGKMKL